MIATTKLYNRYQTVVPREIRKKLGVNPDDIVEWDLTEDGGAKVMFRKKRSFEDIIGLVSTEEVTNAVELKKMAQKGEKIDLR
ncbi:MAG: AbrB/MazE/SpoVT family DNA-binding domain-containing protein [Methanobacteriaceae archaeon]